MIEFHSPLNNKSKKKIVIFHRSWAMRQVLTVILSEYELLELTTRKTSFATTLRANPEMLIAGIAAAEDWHSLPIRYLTRFAEFKKIPIIFLVNEIPQGVLRSPLSKNIKIWFSHNDINSALVSSVHLFAPLSGV